MKLFLMLAVLAGLLLGCSSEQIYQSGQNWQRNECGKLADGVARERCVENLQNFFSDRSKEKFFLISRT